MSANTDLIYDIKRKMLVKYPRFGSEIAVSHIEFRDDLPFHTAATDGKNIYVDPNYFEILNENDRLFTIAHEIMHIKFKHMFRLTDKDGKKRNLELWNIATDAIINANLERDGFTIKDGYVNMPEALNYSAEEFYQKLLEEQEKKKQEQQNQNGNGQNQNGNGQNQNGDEQNQNGDEQNQNGNGQNQNGDEQNQNGDERNQNGNGQNQDRNEKTSKQSGDHSLWEEAFKNIEQNKKQGEKKQNAQKDSKEEQASVEEQEMGLDEKDEFTENREEKREKFKARREKTEQDIRGKTDEAIKLDNIGESKEEIDWKVLIRREVEKTETIWSQRRSIAENNYAYRLEENDIEDDAETEIMIDVSRSVELDLVKAFLRQIKPLLKQSKLRVGCFDVKFFGFIDIKNEKDIDKFSIPKGARGGTDLDLPVRRFTKKREINKIVFTDGNVYPSEMPKDDLKKENIIWLVYGNKNFKPCCGKVINVTEKQLEQLHLINKDFLMEDISR